MCLRLLKWGVEENLLKVLELYQRDRLKYCRRCLGKQPSKRQSILREYYVHGNDSSGYSLAHRKTQHGCVLSYGHVRIHAHDHQKTGAQHLIDALNAHLPQR